MKKQARIKVPFEPLLPSDLRGREYAHEDNDCVVVALSVAGGIEYHVAHSLAAECLLREPRDGAYMENLLALLHLVRHGMPASGAALRFTHPVEIGPLVLRCLFDSREHAGKDITLRSVLRHHPRGRFLLTSPPNPAHRADGHAFAVVDGMVHDSAGKRRPGPLDAIDYVFSVTRTR